MSEETNEAPEAVTWLAAQNDIRHRARRERIATAALQGLLSSWPSDTSLETEHTAIHAVEFADALIAELDK